jgi:hypothetical protein
MAVTRAKNDLSSAPGLRFFSDNYEQIEGACDFGLKTIVPDSCGPGEPKY